MTNPEQIQITAEELPEVKRLLERLRSARALSTGPNAEYAAIHSRLSVIDRKLDALCAWHDEATKRE